MPGSPGLSLEVDDDLAGSSDEASSDNEDEERSSPDEFFCDACEDVRETPQSRGRASPRPIAGLRYSKGGASPARSLPVSLLRAAPLGAAPTQPPRRDRCRLTALPPRLQTRTSAPRAMRR